MFKLAETEAKPFVIVKVTSQFPEEVCFMATKLRFYSRQQNTKICLYKTKVASVKSWLMNLQ
jgi:hypothetical protein